MANNLDAFTTARIDYGRELLSYLRESLFLAATVSKKYSPVGKPRGGTVRVPYVDVPAVQYRTKHNPVTWNDTTAGYIDVPLDNEANVAMVLDSQDSVISDIDWRQAMAQRGAIRIAEAVEGKLWDLYYCVPNVVGAVADEMFKASTTYVTDAIEMLDNQKAPLAPRYGALSPGAKGSALNSTLFASWSTAGQLSQEALSTGRLGNRFGIEWGMSHGIGKHRTVAGTTPWGTPLVDGGPYAIGVKTIHIDGLGAGDLKKGDAFTLDGHNYSLASDVTTAAGDADITIAQDRGFLTAITDGMALTVFAESVKAAGYQQLIYVPEAFAFASAPLDDQRIGTESSIITDEETGLSIRVTYGYDLTNKRHMFLTELLFGVKAVRPDLAVRVTSLS